MYERLKKLLEARSLHADALEKSVKRQLLETHKLGVQAARLGEPELASVCACHIFDMLDWGRRRLQHFSDEDVLPEVRWERRGILHSMTLRDFETLVENELTGVAPGTEPVKETRDFETLVKSERADALDGKSASESSAFLPH